MSSLRATARRRSALIATALVAAVAGAAPADAARILDVRVALHPGFTRVVFDTDGPVAFRVEPRAANGDEVRMHLSADAELREAWLPGADAPSVRLEPEAGGTLARIPAPGPVRVEVQELERPPRVVLDLRRAPTPPAEAETAPTTAPPATPEAPAPTTAPAAAEARAPTTAPPDAAEAPGPPAPTTPAASPEPPAATTPAPDPGAPERAAATGAADVAAPPPAAATPSPAAATPSSAAAAPSGRTPIPETHRRVVRPVLLPKTYVKFIGFAWVALLALALLRRLRQRRLEKPPELQPNVRRRLGLDEPDDEPTGFRAEPIAEPVADPSAGPAPAPSASDRTPPLRPRESAAPRSVAHPSSEDEILMKDLLQILRRLDSRLARVEARLEEMDRGRDGLERQSAAQAQELRSQRAALTRLQRALVRARPPSPRSPTP